MICFRVLVAALRWLPVRVAERLRDGVNVEFVEERLVRLLVGGGSQGRHLGEWNQMRGPDMLRKELYRNQGVLELLDVAGTRWLLGSGGRSWRKQQCAHVAGRALPLVKPGPH